MVLFNKVSISNYAFLTRYKYSNNQYFSENIKQNKFSIILISKLNKSPDKLLNRDINYEFIARNFWNQFINNYWEETIFISRANKLSQKYRHKLKNYNWIINNNNDYKNFLNLFNKYLSSGKISISAKFNHTAHTLIGREHNNYIKYIWRKGINWYIFNLYTNYLSRKTNLINNTILLNKNNININSLPVFLLHNQYNKVILAESSDQIILRQDLLKSIYNLLNTFLIKSSNIKKNYTGLFFINPEDALEYKEYINHKYLKSINTNSLKFFIGHIELYYKLLNQSIYNREFRLIPDLKEVSNVIYKYQYYKNLIFDKKQRYGKNYFQGQPVYIIQSVMAKNVNTGQNNIIEYFYKIKNNHEIILCKSIFLNYKTAIIAWNKFKEEYPHYKLPKKPRIYVSSLENFLQKSSKQNNNSHVVFIPSLQTYKFIKKEQINNNIKSVKSLLIYKSIYIKNFMKQLIWPLTRKNPVN